MSEWQPIETAPKDGTLILTCCKDDEGEPWPYELNYWYEHEYDSYEPAESGLFRKVVKRLGHWSENGHRATHWMPLPEPPK